MSWLVGEFISDFGDLFFIVGMAAVATEIAGPGGLALILSLGALPRLALMLPAGALVDRLDPKRVMVGANVVRCVLAFGITFYVARGTPSLVVLVVFALLFSAVGSLFEPASHALPVFAVDEKHLLRLQGVRQTLNRVALVTGSPAGGLAVGLGGAPLAFGFDAATFVVATLAIAALRTRSGGDAPEGEPKHGIVRDTLDGLRYVLRTPVLRSTLLLLAGMEFAVTGPINVGMPAVSMEQGWGPSGFGIVLGAFGLGAALGPLTLTLFGPRLARPGLIALLASAIGCVAYAAVVFSPVLAYVCVAAVFFGSTVNFLSAIFIPVLQKNSDAAYIGRVMSMMAFGFTGLAPLSMALTGSVIELVGAQEATLVGMFTAAACALAGLCSANLRRVSVRIPDADSSQPIGAGSAVQKG
ncbi:MFS transporter [Streptomyces hydrogenans]|uniref:MFS transporter n=1 Tax=Streptomyces hydrogenans TaxID=1873719 RepID=UPI003634862B